MTTVTNGYTDVTTLKAWSGITTTTFDTTLLPAAVNAASRSIDTYCQTRFWKDGTAVAWTFVPCGLYWCNLNDGPDMPPGIADTAGLIVKTDTTGTGTFDTTWASTDYQVWPVNAANASPEARPYTALHAVGSLTFPQTVLSPFARPNRIQVTAKWGWPAVPDAVTEACLIKAAKLFGRKDSPQGMVAGGSDFGPVRISQREDPDVVGLLRDYRKHGALVA